MVNCCHHILGYLLTLPSLAEPFVSLAVVFSTANLRTKIMDFRGFDSNIILILRGGILISKGDFPESLSQEILVGVMLVGRSGV